MALRSQRQNASAAAADVIVPTRAGYIYGRLRDVTIYQLSYNVRQDVGTKALQISTATPPIGCLKWHRAREEGCLRRAPGSGPGRHFLPDKLALISKLEGTLGRRGRGLVS